MKVVSRATFSLCGFSFFDASPARTPPGARYRSRTLTVLKAGHFSALENHINIFPSPLDKGRVLLRLPAPARVRAAGLVPIFFTGFVLHSGKISTKSSKIRQKSAKFSKNVFFSLAIS